MDYARQNIRHLMQGRSINQLAEAAGIGQTWLQRYMNPDKPSGIQKPNAEKLGPVARALGVPLNDLMFKDLTDSGTRDASEPLSQFPQLDPDIVRDTYSLIRGAYADEGKEYDLEAEPDLFALAYPRMARLKAGGSMASLASVVREIDRARVEKREDEAGGGVERAGGATAPKGKKRA